jgi:hypothetical protein
MKKTAVSEGSRPYADPNFSFFETSVWGSRCRCIPVSFGQVVEGKKFKLFCVFGPPGSAFVCDRFPLCAYCLGELSCGWGEGRWTSPMCLVPGRVT